MKKVKKAVIMAGGFGTRFLPITKVIPKEMLPIEDKPIIQYIVEECIASNIEEILIITNEDKSSIKNYFLPNLELEQNLKDNNKEAILKSLEYLSSLNVRVYKQSIDEISLGDGYGLKIAKDFIGNDDYFALLWGDDLMDNENYPVLKQLIDMHEKTNANVIAVKTVAKEDAHKYGMISYKEKNLIERIVEKPNNEDTPSLEAGIGRYILSRNLFWELDHIEPNNYGAYQTVKAIDKLMLKEDFYACKFQGNYYDIGNKIGYLKAIIDYGLKNEEIRQYILDKIKEF